MARIPVYEQKTTPSAGFSVSQASSVDLNLDAQGRALEGLGRAVGDAAQAAVYIEDAEAKAKVLETARRARREMDDAYINQTMQMPSGDRDFAPRFMSQTFDPWANNELAAAPSGRYRKLLGDKMAELREEYRVKTVRFQAEQNMLGRIEEQKTSMSDDAKYLYNNPTGENLSKTLEETNASIDADFITPSEKARLKKEAKALYGRTGVEAIIEKQPALFLEQIAGARKRAEEGKNVRSSGNPFLDLLDPTEWDTYINKAETQLKQKTTVNRGQLNNRIKNSEAMAVNGIADPNPISREEFVNVYGLEEGEQAYRGYQEMQMMAGEIYAMTNMAPSEIGEMISKSAPQPGPDYAAASERQATKLEAFKRILQMRENDPAFYVLQNNPTVSEIYQKYDSIKVSDPTFTPEQRQEAMVRKKAAAEQYANAMLAEQTRLGIQSQGVLNKDALLQIQQEYLTTPQGEPTAENVKVMSEIWGNSWPSVYSQLISEKILPPMAIVIGSDPNMPSLYSSAMVDASRRSTKDWLIAQPSTTETDLKEYVSNQMQPFMQTMIGASGNARMAGGFETFEVFYNSAMQLAAMYVSRGKTPAEAARLASEQVVLERYNFNESYRVPVEYDMSSVEYGSRILLNTLTTDDLMPTASLLPMDTTLEEQLISIKKYGYWVTDENESGLILYDSGTQSAVLNKDGMPIRKSFDELMKAGEKESQERGNAFLYMG